MRTSNRGQDEGGPSVSAPIAEPTGAHSCDDGCVCRIHGTSLIYSPAMDDHACQDVACEYGHGGAAVTGTGGLPYLDRLENVILKSRPRPIDFRLTPDGERYR
jgi:hypothetical protein